MSDAAFITAKLKQIRRRQFLVHVFHAGCLALPVFAFWLVLCTFSIDFLPRPSVVMQTVSGSILIVAAFAAAVFRLGSWKDTAKLVDQAMGFQQRIETSWESIPPRDEMDILLLKDTRRRIATVIPADVVAIHFSRSAKRLFLICLLITTALGIFRILTGSGNMPWGKAGGDSLKDAALSTQTQTSQKTVPPKSLKDQAKTKQPAVLVGSDPESGSRLRQDDATREFPNIPDQAGLRPAEVAAQTAVPDRGSAGRQEVKTAASRPGIKPGSDTDAGSRQPEMLERAPESGDHSGKNVVAAGEALRTDAGAASIRRAGKTAGTGASAQSAAASGGEMSAGGQRGQSTNLPDKTRMGESRADRLAREDPALRFAAERALRKEKIPPGFKKYIADYFRAIHP